MKYGDLSSIVQLGVGLHVGTAVLQLYGEFGAEPLVRSLGRISAVLPETKDDQGASLHDDYGHLASDYEIFKIRLFQSYQRYFLMNSAVALMLTVVLVIITFKADDQVTEYWESIAVLIVAMSTLPSIVTLGCLWHDAAKQVTPLKMRADKLEGEVLRYKPGLKQANPPA